MTRLSSLVLVLVLVLGCSTAPTRVERPGIYPDRTTPDVCWSTFLWAWRTGDVKVLQQTYGLWLREELTEQVKVQGPEKVSAWYRKDAEGLEVDSAKWDKKGDLIAYLTARLVKPGEPPVEVRFAFMKRDDGWCLDGRKTLR
jgi:hypothetical protein